MVHMLYSIRDKRTGQYGPLFHHQDEEEAKRNFAFLKAKPGSIMNFAPSDFDLHKLGVYDTVTGEIQVTQNIVVPNV